MLHVKFTDFTYLCFAEVYTVNIVLVLARLGRVLTPSAIYKNKL